MNERLFSPFLDPVDGTACVPAGAKAADIKKLAAPEGLRFPLLLDPDAPLADQLEVATHAPASHRFGPFCDNILGMNWQLPSGRVARIGERVVKSTTGYDWLRFLLHSASRFGKPLDYVLRLRPECGFDLLAEFQGNASQKVVHQLLQSGWHHWWESVNHVCHSDGSERVRVHIHGLPQEADLFEAELRRVAQITQSELILQSGTAPPAEPLPDLSIKTTPDRVAHLLHSLAAEGLNCTGYCYNGVVHARFDDPSRAIGLNPSVLALAHAALALGGDWHSRHLPPNKPSEPEAGWITSLEKALHEH
jgi:FAD/FMN-containing dehydrogenase